MRTPPLRPFALVNAVAAGLTLGCAATHAQEAPRPGYPVGAVLASAVGRPDRADQQFHLRWLKHAGLNCVQTEMLAVADGYTSWDFVHAKPGRPDWTAYDHFVADADAAGLDTYLQVLNWRNPPPWFWQQHPDAYMMTPLGGGDELSAVKRDDAHDIPAFPTIVHPAYRKLLEHFARDLARRYKDHPRVRGYFIGEELGLNNIWPPANYYGLDFSPHMIKAFQAHLRGKYRTVAALNKAWGHPDRYRNFADITWRRGWAHEPANYRGEWLDYYQFLQLTLADLFNLLARAIHEEDPDALVLVSGFEIFGANRIGHAGYVPLMTQVDAFAYKSYWRPNRLNVDWLSGVTGKPAWCSNLSERQTTTGPTAEQRYQEPTYVRREFWPAYASGLEGLFVFLWSPLSTDNLQKMNVLDPQSDGSLGPRR
mgnify:CR=1 FL=1